MTTTTDRINATVKQNAPRGQHAEVFDCSTSWDDADTHAVLVRLQGAASEKEWAVWTCRTDTSGLSSGRYTNSYPEAREAYEKRLRTLNAER